MRIIRLALTALGRDWRSGELGLIALAVLVAVASLTCVAFFTDRVERAIEMQATELLAADLVLESSRPIDAQIRAAAADLGLATTTTVSFRSVAVAGDDLQLSEAKAVEEGYPIRGRMRTARTLFGAESETTDIPAPGSAWLDTRLLQALGLEIGDTVQLGSADLAVTQVLAYEPDRGGDLFNIAPRLMLNLADLPATGLLLPGSRAEYRLLAGGPAASVAAFREQVVARDDAHVKVLGIRDARPELRRALERAGQFLGLAVLVSIALCGLAIAMAPQRFAVPHFDTCAVMRCLGATQSLISRLYLVQLLVLAVMFSLAGCALGYAAQAGLAGLLKEMTGGALPAPSPFPVVAGLVAGITAVLGFALPQIWRLRSVSPLRVFRRDIAPLPLRSITVYGVAILTLALLAPWQSGDVRLTLYIFLGLIGAAGLLALGARGAILVSTRLRSRVGVAWRYGLANISRRARGSTAQIVGIGLAATVMLLLTLIRTDLMDAWQNRLPPETPNYFLINIQPDEVAAMRAFLAGQGQTDTRFYPMIRGRLTAINGREVKPDDYEEGRPRRLATREFNLSWARDMQEDNRLEAGEWWPGEPGGEVYFSVEQGIGETLGIGLGDTLSYTVGGHEVSGEVRSLRWVEWDSFHVNFFVVANPGALDGLPATWITSFYLPEAQRPLLVDLLRQFPSTTVIDVAAMVSEVRRIMDQVTKTVEFVFGFTLLAGIIVLFAALQTTHDERRLESAVLSSLGASRRRILGSLAAEFLALGVIAGVLASVAAALVEWVVAELVFELSVSFNPWLWILGPLACITVIVGGGLLGTRRILDTPPIEALRRA